MFKSPDASFEVVGPSDGNPTVKGLTRQDQADMAEQGKKQRFNRNFGFISMLGFTTTSEFYTYSVGVPTKNIQ